eukprot:CAMPEP_0114557072 /NCGR_PEP_ID=MMETSP0114-20121206/9628_1 /TAXON_ID=31324 /ORGANISM="Goniomonas sp, Strain m" /LENGTH=84 /DNA_ID=CAMNT_0001742321 /DNA_START=302 /DNA_END=556 /DNA_ORIENTATION=-
MPVDEERRDACDAASPPFLDLLLDAPRASRIAQSTLHLRHIKASSSGNLQKVLLQGDIVAIPEIVLEEQLRDLVAFAFSCSVLG